MVGPLGPHTQDLLGYWQQLPRRQLMPERRDFDPMAIARILPFVTLLERISDDDWRFRLVGTEVERRWRGRYTGQNYLTLEIVSAQAAEAMRREFIMIVQQPCGSWSRRKVEFRSGRRVAIQTLRLPLRANDGRAGQIISCSEEFDDRSDPTADGPSGIIRITEQEFLDIGAGVPAPIALA